MYRKLYITTVLAFNHRRLLEACGDIPPVELKAAHYRQQAALTEAGHP